MAQGSNDLSTLPVICCWSQLFLFSLSLFLSLSLSHTSLSLSLTFPLLAAQEAAKKVQQAADRVIEAANVRIESVSENTGIAKKASLTRNNIIMELEAQEAILKKERELERARHHLGRLRNAEYAKGGDQPGVPRRQSTLQFVPQ